MSYLWPLVYDNSMAGHTPHSNYIVLYNNSMTGHISNNLGVFALSFFAAKMDLGLAICSAIQERDQKARFKQNPAIKSRC